MTARGLRSGLGFGLGVAVFAGIAISLVECGATPSTSPLTIVEDASAPEFKAEFNRAGVAARLVLLLSPT